MYKILVLILILSLQLSVIAGTIFRPRSLIRPWHGLIDRYGAFPPWQVPPFYHTPIFDIPRPPMAIQMNRSDLRKPVEDVSSSIVSTTQKTPTDVKSNSKSADLISTFTRNSQTKLTESVNIVGKKSNSTYLVTKGIGAHKLHLRKLPWNIARKVCIDEGGQLADIKSDSEEKIVLQMLFEDSVEFAWIGYHDMFEEGEWVSVLGEPFGKSGWDRWWKKRLPNPDNGDGDGEEDCACLMRDGGGINDYSCLKELPFVCKKSAL